MSIVAPAISYFYLRADVATMPDSSTETGNKMIPPVREALAESPAEPDPTFVEPDNAHNKNAATNTLKNGDIYSWPTNIEGRIWEYFAQRGKTNIISINSVECTDTDCEIEFYGTDINPQYVDDFSNLTSDMYRQNWNMTSSSIGTRETAPNVRVFVISISNIPVDMDELRRVREAGRQQQIDVKD